MADKLKTVEQFEQAVRASVQQAFEREANDQRIYKIVRDLIADKWTGKQINARIATQLSERLGMRVQYEPKAWGTSLKFGEPRDEYNPAVYLTRTLPCASVEKLDEDNTMHTEAADIRQAARAKYLKSGKEIRRAAELAHTLRNAWEELYAMDSNAGAYTARNLSGVDRAR